MLTHGELFAGISGFGLGFERAGIKTLWHVEIDAACQSVLRRHYPGTLILSDVCECGARNLPPVDIISFGSPCQDMSVAGKRVGLNGQRSGLFFEAIRIMAELQPAFAVWENVPGAFSSNAGRDFAAVLSAFRECGARDIAWGVLDAQYFGVAQRRRRVFIVADFRGERAAEILFERESLPWDTPPRREAGQIVAGSLGGSSQSGGFRTTDLDNSGAFIAHALGSHPNRQQADNTTLIYPPLTGNPYGDNASRDGLLVAHTLNSEGADASEDGTGRGVPLVGQAVGDRDNRDWSGTDMHPTLAANPHSDGVGFVTPGVRRLTPRECERLQGFPDDWTAGQSDSARYRQLGNAVCVPVAEWIGRRIVSASER